MGKYLMGGCGREKDGGGGPSCEEANGPAVGACLLSHYNEQWEEGSNGRCVRPYGNTEEGEPCRGEECREVLVQEVISKLSPQRKRGSVRGKNWEFGRERSQEAHGPGAQSHHHVRRATSSWVTCER